MYILNKILWTIILFFGFSVAFAQTEEMPELDISQVKTLHGGWYTFAPYQYQIEKNGKMLTDYQDYNQAASDKAGIGLFIGAIFLTGLIMWFKRFNILKFMNRLVQP